MGWIGNALCVLGLLGIGRRRRGAFLFTLAGEVVWGIESWRINRVDTLALCAVFAVLAAWNWCLWGRGSNASL